MGRPPASDSAVTRNRIVHAARDVFRTLGYAGATHAAIAARAAVTRPAVTYHFTGKLALFECLVEHDVAVLTAALDEAAIEPTLRGRLRALLTAVDVDSEVHAATAFLLGAAMERRRNPDLWRAGYEASETLRQFLATAVAGAIDAGELRADTSASSAVDTLHAVVSGIVLFGGDLAGAGGDTRVETMMALLTGDVLGGAVTQIA